MEPESVAGLNLLLAIALFVLAPMATSRTGAKRKTTLRILGGMAVGFVSGFVFGAPISPELAGDLMLPFMLVGGILVSVRTIMRSKSA
jgi:hypothetical protein